MAGVGRFLVGGGAVLLGYTITNNALNKVMKKIFTIISLLPQASEAGRFTPRRLDERRRSKAGGKPTSRQAALHRLSDGVLDVAVVGGTLEAANNAVLLASRGLKVAIITSDDFESGSWSTFGGRQLFNVDRSESSGREWRLLDTAPHLASVGKLLLVPLSLPSLLLLFLSTRWAIGPFPVSSSTSSS